MNAVGIDCGDDLCPLIVIEIAFLLKPPPEIHGGKMAIDARLGQPFAKGRDDLSQSSALARNESGQRPHFIGQSACFRRNEKNCGFLMSEELR